MKDKKFDEVYEQIINKELEPHGVTTKDILLVEDWYSKYTMTTEQNKEWKEWSINLLVKECKFSKKHAKELFMWIDMNHGLKIKD